ncbi:MAG: methyl-accepting chemotaxis protein [Treponema sp.]|nr:methyl-accepting chemotaxis protein [Treponema sp.]MCL2252065.1 methyl-accepting chemotaxis protein [Treponema sp.]
MNFNLLKENINKDEYNGEKLIGNLRLLLSFIYIVSLPLISLIRNTEGYGHTPFRAHIFTTLFLLYSIYLVFYLHKNKSIHHIFKYAVVSFDMILISGCIWITCTYPLICPPVIYLSMQSQFYIILILFGSFRYSAPCAVFSGIFAGLCYLVVILANASALNLPYIAIIESNNINFTIPLYNEFFRILAMAVAGLITGIASKRSFKLFNNMIETQAEAAQTSLKTIEQTRNISQIIQKSTDEIFLSSKNIFSTANNQAATVQEIESTINENTKIAVDIAEKTSNVAAISSKMETNVNHGFSILKRNIDQLEDIKNKNDGVISGINDLEKQIIKIRDIIETINAITDQTKVIAFNAALEAASAGEHGKRFSIVSSEVNRLADDIASLTKEIRKQADTMQKSSASLIGSSNESSKKITEGNDLIKELESIFNEIHHGAEETSAQAKTITVSTQKQQKSSEQINIAISDIAKGLSNFLNSTKSASSSAEALMKMMQELGTILTNNNGNGDKT